MVRVQEMEEAPVDTEDAVPVSLPPEYLAAMSALMRFSLFHGLLSSSIEKSSATLQKRIRQEMSKRQ